MATITPSNVVQTTIISPLKLLAKIPLALWTLAALLVFWEFSVWLTNTPVFILPAPTRILEEIIDYWPRLIYHAGFTLSEVMTGYLFAVSIAIPLAVLVTYSRVAEKAIYPLIVATQSIPKIALAPLLLGWFGYGMTPKIIIVMLLSFFPIVINATVGLKSVSREMIYLAQSMGASPFQAFWKFRLPQAMPNIFAGLKLATVLSVIGAIVAEFIGADRGLGYVITVAGASFDIARQFSAIIFISAIGMCFFALVEFIERKAVPWRDTTKVQAQG